MGFGDILGGVGKVVGGLLGGKAPKKQKATANELLEAKISGQQADWYNKKYVPLEAFEIEQWRDPTTRAQNKALIAGRMSADVASAERNAMAGNQAVQQARGLRGMGQQGALGMAQTGQATAVGMADARIDAARGAQQIADEEGLAIARTGHDVNRGTINSVGGLARAGNYQARARLDAETTKRAAEMEALQTVATAGIMRGQNEVSKLRLGQAEKYGRAADGGPLVVDSARARFDTPALSASGGLRGSGITALFNRSPNPAPWSMP